MMKVVRQGGRVVTGEWMVVGGRVKGNVRQRDGASGGREGVQEGRVAGWWRVAA